MSQTNLRVCQFLFAMVFSWSISTGPQAVCAQSTMPDRAAPTDWKEFETRREALKKYLKSHRLYELYAELLEEDLVSMADVNTRKAVARELAELYAWELNSKPNRFQQISTRLDELAHEFPDAIPLETQINIGYGRYRRAKDFFESWIYDRNNTQGIDQVDSHFVNVIQRATDTLTSIERRLADPSLEPRERRELETASSRFRYLTGWARYYRGVAMSDPDRSTTLLESAERDFLELLEVADSAVLLNMSPQWWPLNSEWTGRLLLGLGMTSQALEHTEQADYCFNLLTEGRVPVSLRENQRVWRFHSYSFAGQENPAFAMVKQSEETQQAAGDIAFWSSVAIAGINSDSQHAAEMLRAGFKGMALANEFQLIDEVHDRFPNVTVQGDDFFALWMNGYSMLKNAGRVTSEQASDDPNKNDGFTNVRAASELQQALESSDTVDPVYRARCRYHLGFANYATQDFDQAAEQFRRSSTVLHSLDPVLAEHAAWMQCQSLHRLSANDSAWRQQLIFALSEFQRRYPNSANSSQATFMQVTNHLDSQSGEQAIAALGQISPGDANYPRARFEICRYSHQLWSAATDSADRDRYAATTIAAAQQYVDEVGLNRSVAGDAARYSRICLLAADPLIQNQQLAAAETWLTLCEPLVAEIQSQRELVSDYYFLTMNFAALRSAPGDGETEKAAGEWLLLNTSQGIHLRAALVSRARMLDRDLMKVLDATGQPSSRQFELVIDAYQRLVDDFSTNTENENESRASNAVARTALLRLGELQTAAGNHQKAMACYLELHNARPSELKYLLGLARSEMQLLKYNAAAQRWRTIASGLTVGHDSWLEAKYNLVRCLLNTHPEKAQPVIQQTRLLVPQMPEPWQARFDELELQLKKQLAE